MTFTQGLLLMDGWGDVAGCDSYGPALLLWGDFFFFPRFATALDVRDTLQRHPLSLVATFRDPN